MTVKEKFNRLLNTRKKRMAAAAALVFVVLVVVAVLLYIILKTERKTRNFEKGVVTREKEPEYNSLKRESGNRSNPNNSSSPLKTNPDKHVTCEEALISLDSSVKAKADQATLEELLEQVEALCPEDNYHAARMSIRKTDIKTQDGVRRALNDALERPTLNVAELVSRFQKLKDLTPTEPSPKLSDYAVNLYEDVKSKEAQSILKKGTKKLNRLLRTVKSLKPDYIDDQPLKEIVDSAEIKDVVPSADAVADAEAQDIIQSNTPNLVNPRLDLRCNFTRKMHKALDSRNELLKRVCELGMSLPVELRAEFNEWKLADFRAVHSPKFVAFMEKARKSREEALLNTLWAYFGYQIEQARFISESHKHRTDDAKYNYFISGQMTRFVYDLKNAHLPISDTLLEWLKGENWEHMKRFVEQELARRPLAASYNQPVFYRVAGMECYRATGILLEVYRIRKDLQSCEIAHSPNLQDYWTAVENAWRSGSCEYEKLKYKEYKNLSEFEDLENAFKRTDAHAYRDDFTNIYESVHVKLNALDFLKNFETTEIEQVRNEANVLGIDPENIRESHLSLFEGCPKVYNLLIIKLFSSKVKEASFDQIGKLLNDHNDEYKKITLELASFKECSKLATKIREGICSISSEGKITCSTPRWNERVNDFKWLGYILFKPTGPYQSSYLEELLSREQKLRLRYDHLNLIHMFVNDISA